HGKQVQLNASVSTVMLRDTGLTVRLADATPSRALGAQAHHSSCCPSPAVWGDSARMRLCFPSDKEGPGGSEVTHLSLVAHKHHPAHVMETNLGRDSFGTPRTEAGSPGGVRTPRKWARGPGAVPAEPCREGASGKWPPRPAGRYHLCSLPTARPGSPALPPHWGSGNGAGQGAARAGPGWTIAVCASPREDALVRVVPWMLTKWSPGTFWSIGISTSAPQRHQAFPASRL
ncbi:hypothetical protein EI555_019447, partial [Monodon monoceros]